MELKDDRRSDVGTMKAGLSRGLGALRHVALAMRHEAGTPGFYLSRANLHLREKKFAECINDCRSYMEQMEDDSSVKDLLAAAHFLRAKELDASGHHDLSLANFDEAIALAPTAPHYAARAGLHKRLGNRKDAESDIDKAIETDPEDWAGLDAKFESYRSAGGLELVRDFYRDLALWKGSALHHYCLGRVCFGLGDFEGAVNCLTVAIVTDEVWPVEWPVGHNPHLLRGIAHLALGDCEAAARDRVSDIRSDVPGRSDLIERCGTEREMEDYKWALEDFERVARTKSKFLDVYRMIDGAPTTGGDNRGAVRMFETLLSMHPEEGQAGELRAEARRRLERIARWGNPSGIKLRSVLHHMPSDGAQIAGTVLIAGAIAAYVSLMSVELVPATLELLGELDLSASTPIVWGGLTIAVAVLALGLDRGISLGRSAFGRAN